MKISEVMTPDGRIASPDRVLVSEPQGSEAHPYRRDERNRSLRSRARVGSGSGSAVGPVT
jgi:hypothetical protein